MNWELFVGDGTPHREDPSKEAWERIPPLRSWRHRNQGQAPLFEMPPGLTDAVNAALHLRRPLLLSGGPGSGKSTAVELIAAELELDIVLKWHITSKSTLKDALYEYDALGRLHATQTDGQTAEPAATDVASFVTLGPLGTALAASKLRAVLIDEIDKSDLDLPGDLLNIMENGEFPIPPLTRTTGGPFTVKGADGKPYKIDDDGVVRRRHFPVIVFTSNGERAFQPPFLRRCVRFEMPPVEEGRLTRIVTAHLSSKAAATEHEMIAAFAERVRAGDLLAINQILEFVYLVTGKSPPGSESRERLEKIILQELSGT